MCLILNKGKYIILTFAPRVSLYYLSNEAKIVAFGLTLTKIGITKITTNIELMEDQFSKADMVSLTLNNNIFSQQDSILILQFNQKQRKKTGTKVFFKITNPFDYSQLPTI